MLLNVIHAKHLGEYRIELTFNNGKTKMVDLQNTIFSDHRKVFEPLRELGYFKRFELILNTISWPNEADYAPEYLYELASIQEKEHVL